MGTVVWRYHYQHHLMAAHPPVPTLTLFKETANQRWERETREVWIIAMQRLIQSNELRFQRGEKEKSSRKKVKETSKEVSGEENVELREVTLNNLEILKRKLSANLARKI